MDIYDELGVKPVINAAGTYTVLGGSRMSEETLEAMNSAARNFVPIREFQKAAHQAIAKLTKNEAAYVSNGAAAGLYLAIAACIEQKLGKPFYYLTPEEIASCNVLLFKAHRNPYDLVIGHLGARYRELSFPNRIFPPTEADLEYAIDEGTAAIYFAASGWVAPGFLPLEELVPIARAKGVPVLVDAAAQLPPVENLWRFSELGADLTLFSGGKDLRGPQASGLMVGCKALLDRVTAIGFPHYGIGRMLKVSREEIAGLYAAIKQYLAMDHGARYDWCEAQIAALREALDGKGVFTVRRSFPNEAGQPIARAFLEIVHPRYTAASVRDFLLKGNPPIYAYSEDLPGIFINPMSLKAGETDLIIKRLQRLKPGGAD
ncbi:MAG: aminotransferase class V-fold PLP-dependent enzyme [Spirochaetaceae bacterium]|jgi:L-seryl-tRNA(Ser) seleniumtransferase|nr:aminotransferase class V-fold PLP-dependent enzyme [Spirochaetaceae bacterium]